VALGISLLENLVYKGYATHKNKIKEMTRFYFISGSMRDEICLYYKKP
jgi:hypothetical protein